MISYFTKWNSLGTKSWKCSRDVHALPWMPSFFWIRIILKFLKIVTKKNAVFDIQVLAQLLSSRLQNLRVGIGGWSYLIFGDSDRWVRGPGHHHIMAPPLSDMKCIPLEFWDPIHAWRSSGYFTNSLHREPRSPPVRSVLVFAQWQQSLETTLVSLAGENGDDFLNAGRWKCWHRKFLTP